MDFVFQIFVPLYQLGITIAMHVAAKIIENLFHIKSSYVCWHPRQTLPDQLQKYDCTDKIRTQLYQRRTSAKFQPPFGHRNKVEMNFKKTLRCFR